MTLYDKKEESMAFEEGLWVWEVVREIITESGEVGIVFLQTKERY